MTRLKEMPPDELPRERLLRVGPASIANSELIAILLRTGIEGTHVLQLASDLLVRFGSLTGIARTSASELAAIKGIGPAKAVQLAAAFELGSRIAREQLTSEAFNSPRIIYQYFEHEFRAIDYESLRLILLNTQLHLIRVEELSRGSLNQTVLHIPDVLRPVILSNAYGFIIVHNHPSGNPDPSSADVTATRKINEASALMNLKFVDHIICGVPTSTRSGYYSFKEAGII